MRRISREFAPLVGYLVVVAGSLLLLAAATLYNPAYLAFIGLVLPVLSLPWGFLSFALTEAPVWWGITTIGGIALNTWLLWRDARQRVARAAALNEHSAAAV